MTPSSCSADWPGSHRLWTRRVASRLSETRWPVPPGEHDDADRRGLDQRLEVGAGAPLGAVGPRVGDRGRGLRGEQHQDLLVLVGERRPARLLDQIEVADMGAAMAHRRALEGLRRQPVRGEAERAHIGRDIGDPKRSLQVTEVLEEPRPVGPLRQPPVLFLSEARGDEVRGVPVSSMVAMAPKRAPVSVRALSTTSVSTVSRSRLALMRRLAALSAEMRARSAAFSAAGEAGQAAWRAPGALGGRRRAVRFRSMQGS